MTLTEISYKDLDTHGHYCVAEVEESLATQYGVPAFMNRKQYVHFAGLVGLRRVLHNRPNELIGRDKLAREVTRHLNYHMLKGDLPERPSDDEEKGSVWM